MEIIEAHTEEHIPVVREIFREYADWLGFDLCFQGFEEELAQLPGTYAPPGGCILLAYVGTDLAACGALRPLEGPICEMKRLYVRESCRGAGIGKALAKRIVERGKACGYERMRLDTVPWMTTAIALYESLGFVDIPPYRPNPIEGAKYLELVLS